MQEFLPCILLPSLDLLIFVKHELTAQHCNHAIICYFFTMYIGWGWVAWRKRCKYPHVLWSQTWSLALNPHDFGQPWVRHPAGCYQLLQWICYGYFSCWGNVFVPTPLGWQTMCIKPSGLLDIFLMRTTSNFLLKVNFVVHFFGGSYYTL